MFGTHETHYSHLHHVMFSDLTKVFMFRSLLSLAQAMIFIFIPIFLYQIGYSVIDILIYAIVIYSTVILFDPLVIKLVNKIGFKYSLALSVPVQFASFFLINKAHLGYHIVYLAAILMGIHLATFFTTLNSEIASKGHREKRGNEMGNLNILMTLASTFSPFIGGFILMYYDYFTLLIVVIIIGSIAVIPLIKSTDITLKNYDFRYKDYIRLIRIKDSRTKIFFLSEGADIILFLYVWPLALYLFLNENTFNFGSVLTASSLVATVLLWIIKDKLDKRPKKYFLRASAKVMGFEYTIKAISYFFFGFFIYLAEIISKINRKVFMLSYQSIYYYNVKNKEFLDYILLCDLFGRIGRVIFGLLLIVIFTIFGSSVNVLFLVLLFGLIITYGLHFLEEEPQ